MRHPLRPSEIPNRCCPPKPKSDLALQTPEKLFQTAPPFALRSGRLKYPITAARASQNPISPCKRLKHLFRRPRPLPPLRPSEIPNRTRAGRRPIPTSHVMETKHLLFFKIRTRRRGNGGK
ncbi:MULTISPECIES: hypothetical protein [unclassified Neisseria]|uniref:hypothetical protein n=1 Tax=unclassified Neisseria TaxID=2623750 RepID=UPI001072BBFC|nr:MULTISPECIES: hypothetical protein [unclassified Neisseria]MBF0803514.1 hypothetical protein [Neisseria sp. 19428wB4_WF04]TFU43797.1 hypothetical protein E4T99_03955 [Neisseria sp. WF04]